MTHPSLGPASDYCLLLWSGRNHSDVWLQNSDVEALSFLKIIMKCQMHSMWGPSEEALLVNKFRVFYETINFITFFSSYRM